MLTEPGAVATGSYIQPAIDNFGHKDLQDTVECLDPVATAPGSVPSAFLAKGA